MSFYPVRTMSWQSKKPPSHPRAGVLWHVWHPCNALCTTLALKMDRTTSDQTGVLQKNRQHGAAAEPGPTQTSASTADPASTHSWTSRHQFHGKAGGRTVPSCWARACSRGRWGISVKEGNNKLYKCSAVQKRLPYWLQDYHSSFWPPPKPGVIAQGTTLASSVFLWTVIYSSQQRFGFFSLPSL